MRKLLFGVLLIALFTALVNPGGAAASGVTKNRIAGEDRFQVAVNITEKLGWGSSGTVILANYLAFADALAATPYAYKIKAPILLTEADKLTQTTKDEINKLKPTHVVIIGGPMSVSKTVIQQLQSMGITNITRIGGEDRFAVAQNIANQMGDYTKSIVANGLKFPDSLTIAPYAARNGYPILLTLANKVPQTTAEALKNHGSPIVVGGPNSVSDSVYQKINAGKRIGGSDRFEVAINIIKQLGLPTDHVFVATGLKFADALTGSVLAAKENAPLLLTWPTRIPENVRSLVYQKNINSFTMLGGTASVSNNLLGMKIVVDAGHGGGDSGAIGTDGTYEATLNLQFAKKLQNDLENLGADVLMTRTSDTFYELKERTDFANTHNADLFLSIHHDSSWSESTSGISLHFSSYRPGLADHSGYVVTFNRDYWKTHDGTAYPWVKEITDEDKFIYRDGGTTKYACYDIKCSGANYGWTFDKTPSPVAVESKTLANRIDDALKTANIGILANPRDHNLFVTRWTNMPSVLIELGFVSNPSELKLLEDPDVQEKRAKSLAQALASFYN